MNQTLCILGRQPALGLIELESLYGADKVQPIGTSAALLSVDPCLLAFDRLGGTVKFCNVLTTLETTKWPAIQQFLETAAPEHSKRMPKGKMRLGLSTYGLEVNAQRISATALSIKKAIQATGRSVRVVPNQEPALNSAQVIHNRLVSPNGWELVFVRNGTTTLCAQTIREQDIASYTIRDRYRPKRDARVGMLPPKLAQIIINLATGQLPQDKLASICEIPAGSVVPRPRFDQTILDPFCGTGVILQEASLMGYGTYGSDFEPRMVDYSAQNLEWLQREYQIKSLKINAEAGDATTHQWQQPFDFVASETYLGRPFTTSPSREILAQTAADCDLIIKKFLRNIGTQIPSGTRLCLAVPAWRTTTGFHRLPMLDHLEELGYTPVSFVHATGEDLIYHRESQIVGRELAVIRKK